MENYNKQITSEVTKSPKNKKKIILISVIAAVVVLVVLMSVLIPVLLLRSPKPTEESYFEFKANEDDMSYSIVGYKRILPESVIIPETYDGYPVTSVSLNSNLVKEIYISKNIKNFYFNFPNIKKVELDSNNSNFIEKEQVIYTSDMKSLILCEPQKTGDYMIPREIDAKSIYIYAFRYSNLSNCYIPKECNFQKWGFIGIGSAIDKDYKLFPSTTNLFFEFGIDDVDWDELFGSMVSEITDKHEVTLIELARICGGNSIKIEEKMPD